MNRHDLAMKLFVHGKFNALQSFILADEFIAESDRQKQQKTCLCMLEWQTPVGCAHCGKKHETAPKREARLVWVCFSADGLPMYAWDTQDREGTRKLYREVLE